MTEQISRNYNIPIKNFGIILKMQAMAADARSLSCARNLKYHCGGAHAPKVLHKIALPSLQANKFLNCRFYACVTLKERVDNL